MALRARPPWQYDDAHDQPITSEERLGQLYDLGLDFEGCTVQTVVVEALLLHAIHLGALLQSGGDLPKVRERLNDLTFGGLINRAKKYLLIPPDLADDLGKYLKDRNLLVHHHLTERSDFDYKDFRDRGDHLLDALYKEVRRRMRSAMMRQGDHATEALWK